MSASRSHWFLGIPLALGLLHAGYGPADEPKARPASSLPPLSKAFPESPEDLRAIEKQVQAVLHKVVPAVVGIRMGAGQGSGVIISKDGYVLTAGHVSGKPGSEAQVLLPDGRKVKARSLGRQTGVDSGLMKITEKGDWPHAEMGSSAEVRRGQWTVAIGHPGGFRPNRTPVVRVGRVLMANKFFIRTDCTIVGGDSGGPLFDLAGRVIGIHSRIGLFITENVHVPVEVYHQGWERLARGESWGGMLGQQLVLSPGGKILLEVQGELPRADLMGPRQQGGRQKVHRLRMVPGSVYSIDMVGLKPGKLDPYLRVEDSSGTLLAEDDDGGGGTTARVVFRPVRDEEYRIIATTWNPGEAGPYKLVIRRLDLHESAVAGRADVLGTLGVPRPGAPKLIAEFSRAGVALHATATLFDAKGKLLPARDLPFHWSKGGKALKTDAHGVARLELKKETVKRLFAEVPAGCKVAFELTDADGNPFPFTPGKDFAKEKVKSGGGKLVLQLDGRLTEDDPFDTGRKQCRRQTVHFHMTPGFTYTLDLESLEIDSYLRLEDSASKQLAEDDDGAGRMNSRIVFRPKREDTFRIVVTTCDPGQDGDYRLTVRQAETGGGEAKPQKKQ